MQNSKTYYVQSTNGNCNSLRVPVNVIVNSAVASPSANGAVVCNGGLATLTAIALQGTFEWYDSRSGGSLLSTNPSFTTAALNRDTTFYVQNIVAGCSSPRTAVLVSILPSLSTPIVSGTTICNGSFAVLTASGSNAAYQWFDAPNGGKLLSSENVFVTPKLFNNTFYYVQSVNQCSSSRTAVQVLVTAMPTVPVASDVTICFGSSTILNASGNGLIEWFNALDGGTLLTTGNIYTTPILYQTVTYYVQSTQNECTSNRMAVTVKINNISGTIFKYSSNSICATALNVKPVIYVPGGTFSVTPSNGLALNQTSGEINPINSTPGHYKISYTYNIGSCIQVSLAEINIGIPNAQFSYNGIFCQFAENPLPTFINGVAGTFSAVNSGLVFVDTSTGQIDLNKTSPGTYIVTNTLSADGGCPPVSATAIVTINKGYYVDAGPDQIVVKGSPVAISGSSDAPDILWSSTGNGTFLNVHDLQTIYTPSVGETIATLTLTATPAGQCSRSDQAPVFFKPALNPPTATDVFVCLGNPATLVATTTGGSIQWYDSLTGGTLLASGPVYAIALVTASATYYVQTTLNGITSSRTPVNLNVFTATAPVAAPVTICFDQTATLTASSPVGTFQWYDAAVGGNLLSTSATYTTTYLIKSTSYFVESVLGNCISSRRQVDVTVNNSPAITSTAELSICNTTPLNYTITSNPINSNFIWSRDAVANISNAAVANQTSTIINEALINTGKISVIVIYKITPVFGGCSGTTFSLAVTVYPDIMVTSPTTANVCTSTELGYSITFSGTPTAIKWSREKVSGVSNPTISNQSTTYIREILINNTRVAIEVPYLFNISSPNCPDKNFKLVVTVNPTSIITSTASGTVCSGEPFNYQALSSTPGATIKWSRRAVLNITNAAVFNQNSDIINETLINTGTDPVDVTYQITPFLNGCPGLTLDYILAVYPKLQLPVITSNSPVCLYSNIALHTTQMSEATYFWTGPNGFTSTLQNPTINNVNKLSAGSYSVTVSINGCISPTSSVDVVVDDPPTSEAGPNQTVCAALNSIMLAGKIGGGTTTGLWSTSGSGTFSPSPTQLDAIYMPSLADISAGAIALSLTSTSPDNCTIATSSLYITFTSLPEVTAGKDQNVCSQDVSVKLNGFAINAVAIVWLTSGDGIFIPSASDPKATYFIGTDDVRNGKVILTLTARNSNCSDISKQVTINFISPPVISAGLNKTIFKGETLVLTPSVNETKVHYLWQPNINIDNDTLKNPTIVGIKDIEYTLQVTDSLGCVIQSKVLITVVEELVIVNTFTPNGDGVNDIWEIPALVNYTNATVNIFDRRGENVFHSTGYPIPFDGIYGGRQLPTGVYYYIIDLKIKGKIYSGSVNLVR